MNSSLSQKIDQAKYVIEDALDTFGTVKSVVAWSAGKDSTLLLKLVLDVCSQRKSAPPLALDIDQKDQFEELIEHRDCLVKDWNIKLLIISNQDVLSKLNKFGDRILVNNLSDKNKSALAEIDYIDTTIEWIPESPVCNHLLKTVPINNAITENRFEAMFTGIRWDEHGARENETYFSERGNPAHTRIHPLLHFTERDIWDATFTLDIPYTSLYNEGYRSLGTKHGTTKNSDIPAWEQDLENTSERETRSKEKEKVMNQLRAWGYI